MWVVTVIIMKLVIHHTRLVIKYLSAVLEPWLGLNYQFAIWLEGNAPLFSCSFHHQSLLLSLHGICGPSPRWILDLLSDLLLYWWMFVSCSRDVALSGSIFPRSYTLCWIFLIGSYNLFLYLLLLFLTYIMVTTFLLWAFWRKEALF